MIDNITISAWLVNEINNSTFSRKERQRYTNTFNELGVFVVVVVVVVGGVLCDTSKLYSIQNKVNIP